VPAPSHADPAVLCQALGAREVKVATEDAFADRFWPCEVGAEPPLSLFGVPIYVDSELARQPRLLMRAGTHEDSIQVDTDDWLVSEHVRIVKDLAAEVH
jgi:Ala-tRNA(Pro) deacylase